MATSNDKAILNSIINPLLPTSKFEALEVNDESCEETDELNDRDNAQNNLLLMNTKKYEKQGICLAESGNLEKAIEMFDKAIACIPTLASAHNNRAQALRLLQRNEEAMKDLEKAIEFSGGKGKAASQAYCQRAMLHHYVGNEEQALKDWESASKLGNQFAKSQLIQRNPYAALCNKMLHNVFTAMKESQTS